MQIKIDEYRPKDNSIIYTEPLNNKKVDTVTIAREKFPGQGVSLDALCKRFLIDNTQREKHSATLDAELLAKVYIELLDAREPSLDLQQDKSPQTQEHHLLPYELL